MVAPRVFILAAIVTSVGCGTTQSPKPWTGSPRALADTVPILEPEERKSAFIYDIAYQAIFRGGGSDDVDAWNLTPTDDVVASTWFTPRLGYEPLTPDDVRRGPRVTDGPDTSGPLAIWSIKAEGITPGFWIRDGSGVRWIVKFDPPDNPELTSGADVVANHLFWAAGYNTPEDGVFYLDPSDLALDPTLEAEFVVDGKIKQYAVGAGDDDELTMEVINENILDLYPTGADGTIRVLVSRFVDGIPKGPFDYSGTRDDDPNDVIRHEFRRELRGLYTIAAWLNHIDVRQGNTLDVFVPDPRSREGERRFGYVRHYLIDFGATLGSGSVFAHNKRHGTEYDLDKGAIGKRFISLGFYSRPWEGLEDTEFPPSIGYYSASNFDPGDWRPNFPNPAFDQLTTGDGYWGAKIVAAFTDEHLAAAVENADYSNPADARFLLDALKERRDATVRYWYGQATPLERARVENGAVVFDDLWVDRFGGTTEYRFEFEWEAIGLVHQDTVTERRIELPSPSGPPNDGSKEPYARLDVWRRTADETWSAHPVTFWLSWDATARSYRVVAVRH